MLSSSETKFYEVMKNRISISEAQSTAEPEAESKKEEQVSKEEAKGEEVLILWCFFFICQTSCWRYQFSRDGPLMNDNIPILIQKVEEKTEEVETKEEKSEESERSEETMKGEFAYYFLWNLTFS